MQDLALLKRLEAILSTLVEYELLHYVEAARLSHHLPLHTRLLAKKLPDVDTQPEAVVQIFEKLGGAFLKLAQMLALRPDLIGVQYSKAFEQLLDHVPPVPFELITRQVNASVSGGMQVFRSFSPEPLASGSIAQVHKAVLMNGKIVAVKVKRPGVEKTFAQDIAVMQYIAEQAKKHLPLAFADPVEIVEEFRRYTSKEMDFMHELKNMQRFRTNFRTDKAVVIPHPHEELSTRDVLVMEFIDGKSILELKHARKSISRKTINVVISMTYTQLFEHGFFHADLHPGNIFLLRNGKIALLDFGIVGYIDSALRRKLTQLFRGLVEGNLDMTARALVSLNISDEEPNLEALKEGVYYALGDYYQASLAHMPLGRMFNDSIEVARESHLKLPPQLVLFGKSIITLEGFVREVQPDFDVVSSAKPFLEGMIRRQLSPRALAKELLNSGMELHTFLSDAPQLAWRFSHELSLVEHRIGEIERSFNYAAHTFWKVSRLLIFTIIFAAVFITSGLLVNIQPKFHDISILTLAGLSGCFLLLLLILRSIRDFRS